MTTPITLTINNSQNYFTYAYPSPCIPVTKQLKQKKTQCLNTAG